MLLGKADERINRNGHDRLSVFGIGCDLDAPTWRGLFRQLIASGHLAVEEEGHGALELADKARPLLRGEQPLLIRRQPRDADSRVRRKRRNGPAVAAENEPLFSELKALRLRFAAEAHVAPFIICHDRTLAEIAERRPMSVQELGEITGLGARRIARYGTAVLEVVARFKAKEAARSYQDAGLT